MQGLREDSEKSGRHPVRRWPGMPEKVEVETASPVCVTRLEVAQLLGELSSRMFNAACVMDYYGGFAEWAKHGRELAGAAMLVREWADEIAMEETGQRENC